MPVYFSIPTCLISTWIIDRRGLRTAIFIGVILVFLGGLICAISSFPGIGKHISRSSISASYLHNLSGMSEEKVRLHRIYRNGFDSEKHIPFKYS